MSWPGGDTAPIKDGEIDLAIPWPFAEDEARHDNWDELIELLRKGDPKHRPLTRGERLFLADVLDGKIERLAKRPAKKSRYWHSDVADAVAREVGAHQKSVKFKKQAVGLAMEKFNLTKDQVEKLEKAGRVAHDRLQDQYRRVIADIKKRGYQ